MSLFRMLNSYAKMLTSHVAVVSPSDDLNAA